MRKKKKYILIRKIASFFFVLVIGVVFTLQGFCASPTKNYIKYDNLQLSSYVWNGGTTQFNNDLVLDSVDTWYNYFYPVSAYPYETTSYYTLRIVFKDFFTGLSSDSSYHYHLTFGFTGGSTVYSKFNSSGTAFVFNSSFTTSKSSVSNGDTRFIFDFDISGMSGNSDLVLSFSTKVSSATFLCSSWGDASYYTVVTGTDKLTSYFDQPVTPPANQGGTDTTISDYQQKEDQLTSNAAGVVSDLPGMISALDMSDFAGGFNLFNDLFTDFWSRSGKLKMIALFAIVSGSVMVILGLGVRGSRRLDPDKPPKEVIHKHYLAGKSKDNSSNKGSD